MERRVFETRINKAMCRVALEKSRKKVDSFLELTIGHLVLVLALVLIGQQFAQPVAAQIDCIDACLQEYDSCQNAPHPMFCDDTYNECVDGCLQ